MTIATMAHLNSGLIALMVAVLWGCWTSHRHFLLRRPLSNNAVAAIMALNAHIEWNVEEYCVHFVVVVSRKFDPVLALVRREIGGVYVIHGTLGDETGFEHRTQVREDQVLIALFAHVIEEQSADHVARKRRQIVALEPRTLAGTW